MINRFQTTLILLTMSACGEGMPPPDLISPSGPITFDTFAEGRSIASDIEASNSASGLMNPEDLLNSGSASYEGVAEIQSTAGLNAIGVANLTVLFEVGNESISGHAGEFIDVTDAPVSGELTIAGGSFDRDGNAGADLSATVSGSLDESTYVILSQSPISGEFYGDAEGIALDGAVSGLVNGAPTTFDVTIVAEIAE